MKNLISFLAVNGAEISIQRDNSTGETCLCTGSARHFMELTACWHFFKQWRAWKK
jgi:hypothetical protein